MHISISFQKLILTTSILLQHIAGDIADAFRMWKR